MPPANSPPRAVIFGCGGATLTETEVRFFAEANPLGLILFARNVEHPTQVRALCDSFREAVGRADAPILIDQEGGRVARLRPPHWRPAPAPGRFAALARHDLGRACEAVRLNAELMAAELVAAGIDVVCTPVLDLSVPGASDVIGDRALGDGPASIAALGRAVCEAFLGAGVMPVVKHIPGHGRALLDSHVALPEVDAPLDVLAETDFEPFRRLADMPWAMTAHVIYRALDSERAATVSPQVVADTIRGRIGFDGVLVSDDICMKALSGTPAENATAALAAGCDLVLHCNGVFDEMAAVAAITPPLTAAARARLARGAAMLGTLRPFDRERAQAQIDAALDAVQAG